MLLDTLLGYLSIVLIIASTLFTWQIWRITRSKAILWLFGCLVYTAIARSIIVIFEPPMRNLMLLPFYISLSIAMWSLLNLLRHYIKPSHETCVWRIAKQWLAKLKRK